jgi:NADH:ubiquinone oxidoreductase subunit 3 (subunit A)
LIFDLEISFLFPFIMCLDQLTIVGVGSMFIFLLVLTVGFYYE